MSLVFGYLFEWEGVEDDPGRQRSASFRAALLAVKSFRFVADLSQHGAPKWSVYHFLTPKPFLGQEADTLNMDVPYTYSLYVRVNERTHTIVVAGARYTITEEAVKTFNAFNKPGLQRKVINIRGLSEHLMEVGTEKQFAVTYLLADVPGYGSSLNSMALMGDDVGAADFMVEERARLTARQLGVRSVASRAECGRFGSLGSVQFRTDCLQDFESFLGYAYQSGYYIS
jgi:hypothetical protein